LIKTKSVLSPIDRKNDGFRVLVTRFRGRGLPKERYDIWSSASQANDGTPRFV